MRLIAKRYIDLFAPGAEIPAGHYSEPTLRGLLRKGHVVEVADAPVEALTIEEIPEAESDTVTRIAAAEPVEPKAKKTPKQ